MKKGFTLVELLAVIVILAILALIAIPSSIGISNNIKKKMYCEKVNMINQSARSWGNDHLRSLSSSCYIEKTVLDLVNEGVIKKESETLGKYVLNPFNNNPMDYMIVRIYLNNKRAAAWLVENDATLASSCENKGNNRPTRKC